MPATAQEVPALRTGFSPCVKPSMRKAEVAYRGGEFGRLSRLSTLLPNWGQWSVECRNIVRGEASVELSTGVVGPGGHLIARIAQRTCDGSERGLLTGRSERAALPNTRRKGHDS